MALETDINDAESPLNKDPNPSYCYQFVTYCIICFIIFIGLGVLYWRDSGCKYWTITRVRMTQIGLVTILQIDPAVAVDRKYSMHLL